MAFRVVSKGVSIFVLYLLYAHKTGKESLELGAERRGCGGRGRFPMSWVPGRGVGKGWEGVPGAGRQVEG